MPKAGGRHSGDKPVPRVESRTLFGLRAGKMNTGGGNGN